jgi:hypothetical protein
LLQAASHPCDGRHLGLLSFVLFGQLLGLEIVCSGSTVTSYNDIPSKRFLLSVTVDPGRQIFWLTVPFARLFWAQTADPERLMDFALFAHFRES